MSHNLKHPFEYVNQTVKSGVNIKLGMQELIDYCQKSCPDEEWNILKELDFTDDLSYLQNWLKEVLLTEPPPRDIQAFWFGLFNPILEDGQPTCDLYISGSVDFDPEDETGDWACWTETSYIPEQKYAKSKVLTQIYRTVSQIKHKSMGEYVLCLGYASLAIVEICRRIDNHLLLGDSSARALAVGFDSGDFVLLGEVNQRGLQQNRVTRFYLKE
jgi:hypothetical protein